MEKRTKDFIESEIREANDSERSIVHFISTETTDRYGDVVRVNGMDDTSYSKNPIVLWGHDSKSMPIGKSLWRKQSEKDGVKGILAKTQFADTQMGNDVYGLWKGGFINASSIGFIPSEYTPLDKGYDFTKWELLEYSIVPIPANPDALRLALDKGIVSDEKLRGELEAKLDRTLVRKLVGEIEALKELGGNNFKDTQFILSMIDGLKDIEAIASRVKAIEEKVCSMSITKPEIAGVGVTEKDVAHLVREAVSGAIRQATGKLNF